ncbi:hypothetical protein, partial [Nostoc sp.]|uniref:hypothetical protein n=1 Tax=Nostoc sp. TaxID=1180 RepID=UPI002FFADC98
LLDKTRPIFFYHKLLYSLPHKLFSLFRRPVSGASSVHRIEQELGNEFNRSPSEQREVLEELLKNVVAQGYWSYLIRRELQAMEQE